MRFIGFILAAFITMATYGQRGNVEWRTTIKDDSIRVQELVKKDVVISRRYYVGNRPVGIWQQFDKKGNLLVERDFSKLRYGMQPGLILEGGSKDTTSRKVVDHMPEFPGGEAELFKFLGENIKYPSEAVDEEISGVVYIIGVVDTTGDWSTRTVLRGVHPLLDYEAWQVTESMPDWTPAVVDGKPGTVQYNLPIRFTLR